MKTYGIFNIESCNYNLNEEETVVYSAEMLFTKSGLAYYRINASWWQYLKFKIKFWWLRKKHFSKIHIRRIK